MKMPNPKVLLTAVVTALGIAATLTSPALAQQRDPSRHERMSQSPRTFDYRPGRSVNSDIPSYGNAPYDERDDW
jgi:hypothetical protein